MFPLSKLGRRCASSVHTKQVTNSVNYSKSYEKEEAQNWRILKLRPADLMQNTGSHHSTTLWSCTAGPESKAEMFEFFSNNQKNCSEKLLFFCKYHPGQPFPLPLSTTPSSRKNAAGRQRISHSTQRTT